MKNSNTKPKYFCESCGEEVPSDAKFCKKCGSFFAAVRCPQCGFTGNQNTFKNGCPKCHYAVGNPFSSDKTEAKHEKKKLSSRSRKAIRNAFDSYEKKSNGSSGNDAPAWLFAVCVAVLIALFIVLFIRCQ